MSISTDKNISEWPNEAAYVMIGYHPSKYYNGKYYRKLDWDGVIHFAMEGKQAHLYFWQSESGLGYWNLDDRNQIYFDGINDFNKGGYT